MSDLVTTTEAARRKGCTPMAVRNAIARGELNGSKLGHVWAVADDAALEAWQVKETGGRLHRDREGARPLDVSADTSDS